MKHLLAFLVLLASAYAADAQTLPIQLQRLDSDGDGAVSRAEYDAARTEDFRQLDLDGDNQLSAAEFLGPGAEQETPLSRRRQERFRELDADGDEAVSAEEYESFGGRLFTGLDRNGDGRVTPDEVGAANTNDRAGVADRLFARLDSDGDGFITLAELDGARRRAFARLDRDRNESLTPDEFALSGRPDADRRFRALDASGDGRINMREYLLPGRALIGRADTDNDGRLSAEEFAADAR